MWGAIKNEKMTEKELVERVTAMVEKTEEPLRVRVIWPKQRKESELSKYHAAARKEGCETNRTYCDRVIDFRTDEKEECDETAILYRKFTNNLLTDYPFMKGTGGTGPDTDEYPGITKEQEEQLLREHLEKRKKREKTDIKMTDRDCILVRREGKDEFVINPHGYSYARYVGIIEDNV